MAGNIWLVEAGHPRKDSLIEHRFVVGNAGIESTEELTKQDMYKRTLSPWQPELVAQEV